MAVTLTQTFDVDDPDAPVLILTFVGDGTDLTATAISDSYQNYLRSQGKYLFTVLLHSATDDAFTFTLTDTYSQLFTQTTAAATSGELGTPTDRYKVNDQLYAAISNLANGATATVKCTFA